MHAAATHFECLRRASGAYTHTRTHARTHARMHEERTNLGFAHTAVAYQHAVAVAFQRSGNPKSEGTKLWRGHGQTLHGCPGTVEVHGVEPRRDLPIVPRTETTTTESSQLEDVVLFARQPT